MFIGRTADNDLQIESKYVSRHHAQIVTTHEGSWLEDLNSTNGVFVRGRRVRRHRLEEGDVVKLGMHDLAYYRIEPPGLATTVLPGTDDEAEVDEEEVAEGGEA
jgi:pSer/pThr/pTyr-binding forkhead associated (FHA) protein